MVLPLVVMGGVMAASAAMQWMNSDAARKATAEERQRMQDVIDKIKDPSFDKSRIQPEEYQVLEKYVPQAASYVQEVAPTVVKAASEGAVAGRAAQMGALQKFRNLGETGEDTQSRILQAQALRDAQIQNQGQQGAIQQNMQARGLGGSGMEFVSKLLAQQGANQSANQSSMNAANSAYQNRLQAMRDAAGLGGQIRNEDVSQEEKNANIINSYNQRMAGGQNAYNQYVAGLGNQAQMHNQQLAQQTANMNVGQRNDYNQNYQKYMNSLAQNQFNNQTQRANMQAGQSAGIVGDIRGNAQDKNNAIAGVAQGAGAMYGYSTTPSASSGAATNTAASGGQGLNLTQNSSQEDPDYLEYEKRKAING